MQCLHSTNWKGSILKMLGIFWKGRTFYQADSCFCWQKVGHFYGTNASVFDRGDFSSVLVSCWEGKRSSLTAGRGAHLWLWVCAPEAGVVCCDPSALSLWVSVTRSQQERHHRRLFLVLVKVLERSLLWREILFKAALSLQTNPSHRLHPESVDQSAKKHWMLL